MEKLYLISFMLYCIASLMLYKKIHVKVYFAPIVPLLIAAGQAGYQLYQSSQQKKAARKAMNNMPSALTESANIAKTQASVNRYPGQEQDEAAIRQGTADTFNNMSRSTTSSSDLLNSSSLLQAQQQKSIQQIAKQGSIFKQNALDKYRGALSQISDVQDGNRRYAENLRGAASRNEYNAVNSLGAGVATAFGQNDWNKTFGGNSGAMNPNIGTGSYNGFQPNSFRWNNQAYGGRFFNPTR